MGIDRDTFFRLGTHPDLPGQFHMTVTAMRLSAGVNGVSRRHGQVSRNIWRDLWPGRHWEAVPIGHVTNGVHLATWMASPVMHLLDDHLGRDWGSRLDDPGFWDQVLTLDHQRFWETHLRLKQILANFVREEARRRFATQMKEAAQVVGAGTLLDPMALTIGFGRRFATYKRANLIFRDLDRLRRLLVNPWRPVQIIFAGKAHPADNPGKEVLQSVYQFTRDPAFEGRVAFLEDYDMHLAHLLVQGVDLWLNLPRVPLEASGTSGMKAALNGIPQLSTLDGWWQEGYDGLSGWAISPAGESDDADATRRGPLLPPARGAGDPAVLHAQRLGCPARLGREDASRAAARGVALHRPPHAPGLRAGTLRSSNPWRVVRRRSADGVKDGRMSTVQEPGMAPADARPPLARPGGEAVSVVHITAEYYPFARTGGLAEAVNGLASFQRAAGLNVLAILPLYRTVRDVAPISSPSGAPFLVPMGDRTEEARVYRILGSPPGPQVFFIEHLGYFNRPGIYGENAIDYADNAAVSPSSRSRRSPPCPVW